MKNYVIVGNGIAAAGCIEGIRSLDRESPITVVSEEKRDVYCRPLISYYLEGKTDLTRMRYRSESFYRDMGCRVLYGRTAVSAEPEKSRIVLGDGTVLPYSDLCVATGSTPFVPPFEGLETVGNVFSFMTLDDALALEEALFPDSRVLIVGAGLIGLKCAEGILERVKSVTVCDLADRILSSILDSECAALMQKHLEAHGIRFLLNDSAVRFAGDTAWMKSGAEEKFDILVLAVGVRPNVSIVRDAGGEIGRGIRVDTEMHTSIPHVFAAGDCTESFDASSGQNRVMAILPNAYMQGHAAGVNMAGGSERLDSMIPMNSIGFFGLHAMTAGSYEGETEEEKTDGSIHRLFVKDGYLKGFILIGCSDRAGIYTSLIRDRIPLESLDFEMLKKAATTAAFPADIRRKKFGGIV